MILVTGGTGLVGSHLLYELALKNESIRAIYRNENSLNSVKKVFSYYTNSPEELFERIEWFKSDITTIPTLVEAFENVDYVYHCAALISFNPNDFKALQQTNIEGTANIVNLCLSEGVKKLCYVSSVATLGSILNQAVITEDNHWNDEDDNSVYSITKYDAELEVWRGTQEGLKAVIVNPGVIVGPGYWNSGSGQLFKRIYKGLSFTTNGKVGCVDVLDVVDVMQELMNGTIEAERYILVSENLSYKAFINLIAVGLNVKSPKREASKLLLQIAWRLDWLKSNLTGNKRSLTKSLASTLTNTSTYNSIKIKNELNFQFRDLSRSINEACKLFLKS